MTKKIKRFKIDLRNASEYVDGEIEQTICEELAIKGLFSEEHLYSFFDYLDVGQVIESGSTRDTSDNVIYAFKASQSQINEGRVNCTTLDRINEDESPGLAIFDGKKLKDAPELSLL
jgi:hypothetical protein